MLQVIELTKYYRRVPVVNEASFSLRPGDVTGYLGPNGSGKSTTVKMLAGLIEPSSGTILFNGENIQRDVAGYKARIGYVPEEAHVYPALSGMEYLQLMGRLRGLPEGQVDARTKDLLKLFSLFNHRHSPSRFPDWTFRPPCCSGISCPSLPHAANSSCTSHTCSRWSRRYVRT
jgi:ABC-2 type transport system ATP-binding protein